MRTRGEAEVTHRLGNPHPIRLGNPHPTPLGSATRSAWGDDGGSIRRRRILVGRTNIGRIQRDWWAARAHHDAVPSRAAASPKGHPHCPLVVWPACDGVEPGYRHSKRCGEMGWTGPLNRSELVALPSATSTAACPGCSPVGLNRSPLTERAFVGQPQCSWNNGAELTHIAPIHYHPGPAGRIWTVGAIFRPAPCLDPRA
jgi:hypothetical protein